MKRIKALFCMVLCIGMIVSFAPTAAALSSGKIGEDLTWILKDDGVLTIRGTGAMPDYDSETPPWQEETPAVKMVVFEEGVTYIGTNTFSQCTTLTEIAFPSTLKEIAPRAFYNCGVKTLKFPVGLEKIGEMAFTACYSLTDVEIPEGVKVLDKFVFEYCTALKTVKIPKSIEKINWCIFRYCNVLENIYYAGSEEDWKNAKIESNWAHLAGDFTFHYNTINCKTQFLFTIGEKTVIVNGVAVENDVAPIVVNGRTMLPIRFLAEKLGLDVYWDGTIGMVTVIESTYRPNTTMVMIKNQMSLVVVSTEAVVNSEIVPLDTPAFIQDGRTFLPVRLVAEALDCYVGWNEKTQQVLIEKY